MFVEPSEHYNQVIERMNGKNSTDYNQLLQDLGAHDKWSLSAFPKKSENNNNLTLVELNREEECVL